MCKAVVRVAAALSLLIPAGAVWGESVTVCFREGGSLKLVQREVAPEKVPLEAALEALAGGPTAAEQADGIYSAIPAGVTIQGINVTTDGIAVDFSPQVLVDLDDAVLAAIFEQALATLRQFELDSSVRLTSGGNLLSDYLPPPPEITPPKEAMEAPIVMAAGSALSGKNITIGPSHGRFWNGSGWYWQRGDPCGFGEAVLEDTNSVRLMQFLYQYLTQDGAEVHVPRALNEAACCHSGTGLAWWKMAARYWLQTNGLPASVWDSSTTDSNDDIRCRPLFADYRGSHIYIAHHTNAGGGGTANGTETFRDTAMEHPAHETASYNLAVAVNNSVVNGIREMYDGAWSNRGVKDANGGFGEIRIPNRPAILIELAFHDNCSRDAQYLTDNFFRSVTQWSLYRGVCQYFGVSPTWDRYSNEYVSDTIPTVMNPGQVYNVSITFRNRGVLWNNARSFRLGAVGDSDPFTTTDRVNLSGEVGPGATYTFNITLTAPTTNGSYVTDWRMLREGVAWFGATVSKTVTIGTGFPTITDHPDNLVVAPTGTATFTVAASGDPPLSYQWQKGTTNLTNGGRISGATSTTLQITNCASGDAGSYRCVVTNPNGSVTSNAATLTITPPVYIVESRAGGQNVAKYSETGVWGDSSGKSTAPGCTAGIGSRYGSSYRSVAGEKHALFKADLPVAGNYEVYATWAANSNRRSPILHRISHAGGTSDVNVDQAAIANVWLSLGTFSFNAGTDAGQVDVSNLNIDLSGSMYADAVKWEFRSGPAAPTITAHPVARNICPTASTTFTVTASGAGLIYQWQKNSADLADGGHYSGVSTATLTVSNADAGDVAEYRCVVSNTGGSVDSNQAALTLKTVTTITQDPPSEATLCLAGSTQLTVTAGGDGTLTYQWQKDSVDLVEGPHYFGVATSALTISDATTAEAGSYRCIVTGGCGSATSAACAITISPDNNGNGISDDCEHRTITAWKSIRTHAGADAAFELDALLTPGSVEPRQGGVQKIQAVFDGPITLSDPLQVTVVSGETSYPNTVSVNESTMEIVFDPPLPDGGCYTISIGSGAISSILDGDTDCSLRTLVADVTGNGVVNLGDVLFARAMLGQPVADAAAFDVDLSGAIDAADLAAIKALVTSPSAAVVCP